ncbi:RpiB/LacA/LacB family sugar-phosphate isomerase, partial [Candidatus Woesearchaeota archaeon]|nr:RpiB/LacA/LacB family sugar-phosphate isomerase [Candidatus Woesearchaeota archaeon]
MIYLASDHAGFFLKERLKEFFNEQKISYLDIGPSSYEESDDYPDYIVPAARKVA